MKRGGRVALAFTPYSGQKAGVAEALAAAGFDHADLVESDHGFCATATKAGRSGLAPGETCRASSRWRR